MRYYNVLLTDLLHHHTNMQSQDAIFVALLDCPLMLMLLLVVCGVCSLQVMVDSRAEAVLVPIYGVMVPLHITTVRNVNHTAEQESSAAIIRISLNFG